MPHEDLHVHSTFSDGRDSVAANLDAAEAQGLERLGCVDHVRRDTSWVPAFVHHVRSAARSRSLQVVVGVEAKILTVDGHLDVPELLAGVDRVYVADHQLPTATGPMAPRQVRHLLRQGLVHPDALLHDLCVATARALALAPAPPVVAHLFSLLPKLRLSADQVADDDLDRIVEAAVATGAWLELDERWRCPGPAVAARFADAGVPIVLSSDAHTCDAIGRYTWAPGALAQATGQAEAA